MTMTQALPWILCSAIAVTCAVVAIIVSQQRAYVAATEAVNLDLLAAQKRAAERYNDLLESKQSVERQLNTTAEMCTSLMRDIDANHAEMRDLKSQLESLTQPAADRAAMGDKSAVPVTVSCQRPPSQPCYDIEIGDMVYTDGSGRSVTLKTKPTRCGTED